jgi:hypothetical protein
MEDEMFAKQFAAVLMLSTVTLSAAASEGGDCFPMCEEAAAEDKPAEIRICDLPGARTVEEINNQVQPIKEIVGYVRSPQGLAVKLVNDHVFKIPPWVGYAMDPVGSLKQRAIKEVRTRAKEMVGLGKDQGCIPPETTQLPEAIEVLPAQPPVAPEVAGEVI